MNARQFAARTVVVAVGAALVAGFSAGAYQDLGGWTGVAAAWVMAAIVIAAITALVWGLDNWKPRP